MALNFAGAATFTAAGAAIATIDTAGNLSIPNRPLLVATQFGTGTAIGADIIFDTVSINNGNNYNAANGRFTAPIAGVYHVMWRQLAIHTSISSSYVFGLYVNNVYHIQTWTSKMAANTWNSNSYRTHVYMNAGDYCTLRYNAGDQLTYTDGNYAHYSVQLVG